MEKIDKVDLIRKHVGSSDFYDLNGTTMLSNILEAMEVYAQLVKNHGVSHHVSVSDQMIEIASEAYAKERHPARWDGEPWGEAGRTNHRLAIKAALESVLNHSR